MSASSSSERSIVSCEVCGCVEEMYERAPCCHAPLCKKHVEEFIIKDCWMCDSDEKICKVCAEVNYYVCENCGKCLCDEHNTDENCNKCCVLK